MKKYCSFTALLFFISLISYSQNSDTVIYSVKYEYLFAPDSMHREIKQNDMLVLEMGKNLSSCYSLFNRRKSEAVRNDLLQSENGSGKIVLDYTKYNNLPNGRRQIEMKSTSQNKMIVLDNIFSFKCYYADSLNLFDWSLTTDTCTILSFHCQKATTHFKGRDFIAWFSSEIPYANGPMKFGGLPGLILKIYDENRNFEFTCISIERPKETAKISFSVNEYQKYSREEIKKLYVLASEDPMTFINSTVPNLKVNSITLPNNLIQKGKKSNPLELD
jgi:GLPGLI family protein